MKKRLLSLLLCVCMVLSCLTLVGAGNEEVVEDVIPEGEETVVKEEIPETVAAEPALEAVTPEGSEEPAVSGKSEDAKPAEPVIPEGYKKQLIGAVTPEGISIQVDGVMPCGAALKVSALTPEVLAYVRGLVGANAYGENSFFFAYDVKIVVGEGEEQVEYEPKDFGAQVFFAFAEEGVCFAADAAVYHVTGTLEELEARFAAPVVGDGVLDVPEEAPVVGDGVLDVPEEAPVVGDGVLDVPEEAPAEEEKPAPAPYAAVKGFGIDPLGAYVMFDTNVLNIFAATGTKVLPAPEQTVLSNGSVSVKGDLPEGAALAVTSIADPFAAPAPAPKKMMKAAKAPAAASVQSVEEPAAAPAAETPAEDETVTRWYDIKLVKDGAAVQPDGTVAVTFSDDNYAAYDEVVFTHYLDDASSIAKAFANGTAVVVTDAKTVAAFPAEAAAAVAAGYAGAVIVENFSNLNGNVIINGDGSATINVSGFSCYSWNGTKYNHARYESDSPDNKLVFLANSFGRRGADGDVYYISRNTEIIVDTGHAGGAGNFKLSSGAPATLSNRPANLLATKFLKINSNAPYYQSFTVYTHYQPTIFSTDYEATVTFIVVPECTIHYTTDRGTLNFTNIDGQTSSGKTVTDKLLVLGNGTTVPYQKATTPTVSGVTGYEVGGWYTQPNGGGTHVSGTGTVIDIKTGYGFTINPDNLDITLYAKLTPINYNITYNLNGGTNNPANPSTYNIESPTITLQNPTREGYTFTGWTEGNSIPHGSTGDKTFTANWKLATAGYTVTHMFQNVSGDGYTADPNVDSKTGTIGQSTAAEARSVTGFTAQSFSQKTIAADDSDNIIIYYDRNSYDYTINHYKKGTTTPLKTADTGSAKYGASVTVSPADITGYTYDSQDKTSITINTSGNTANVYYTPITYTITYDSNGGSAVSSDDYTIEDAVTIAAAPTKEGWKFAGWEVDEDAGNWTEGTAYDAEQVLDAGKYGNVTLVADWTRLYKYKLNFDPNLGTDTAHTASPMPDNKEWTAWLEAQQHTFTWTNVPQRDGYTFLGWAETADGAVLDGGPNLKSYTVAKDNDETGATSKTLYAKWQENKATITYVAVTSDGGTVQIGENAPAATASEEVLRSSGTPAGATAAAKENYQFVGWYDNEDCTGDPIETDPTFIPDKTDDGTDDGLYGTATYYAKFAQVSDIKVIVHVDGKFADKTLEMNGKINVSYTDGTDDFAGDLYSLADGESTEMNDVVAGKEVWLTDVTSFGQGDRYSLKEIKYTLPGGTTGNLTIDNNDVTSKLALVPGEATIELFYECSDVPTTGISTMRIGVVYAMLGLFAVLGAGYVVMNSKKHRFFEG